MPINLGYPFDGADKGRNAGLNRVPDRRTAPSGAQHERRSIAITPRMAALLAGRDRVSEIGQGFGGDRGPAGRWGRPSQ